MDCLLGDSASIVDIDQLEAIADPKDGQTKLEDGWIIARSISIIDTVGTA